MELSTYIYESADNSTWVKVVFEFEGSEPDSRHCPYEPEMWDLTSATDEKGNDYPMQEYDIDNAIQQIKDAKDDDYSPY